MRTDADHPPCVRDPAIELVLGHTGTLTDEWSSHRLARRLLSRVVRSHARPCVHSVRAAFCAATTVR